MSRTISWSVWEMCSVAGGAGSAVPLRVGPSPLRCVCGDGAPLAHGWCMAAGWAGGGSLRDRLRGGRCPAPSSPESLEARLAREPRPERRAPRSAEITSAPAASASKPPSSDVTVARTTRTQRTISLCSSSIDFASLLEHYLDSPSKTFLRSLKCLKILLQPRNLY